MTTCKHGICWTDCSICTAKRPRTDTEKVIDRLRSAIGDRRDSFALRLLAIMDADEKRQ